MRIKNRNQGKAWFEITLLIIGIFAFAYILRESSVGLEGINRYDEGGQKLWLLSMLSLGLKILIKIIFSEKNLVSALEASDLEKGVSTCVKGKDGSICQEYPASECKNKCANECLPSTRENVPSCKLGTCYDENIGTCQERATKEECESNGGKFFDDPAGNVAECMKACCVVGDEVVPLITARECAKIGETSGINTVYRPEIKNEIVCLALAKTKVEGACVFDSTEEKKCRFLTKEECLGNSGKFFEGLLCTNPELNMGYKKQATAKCVEGKDEIYWFDSEGNRENIYDANKVKSWNNGKVLIKKESCNLGGSSDELNNQKTCGNCNRLLGSVCGEKTDGEKLSDNSIDVVCRDMRCIDKNGKIRENGESWCEYQGAIGTDEGSKGYSRSVDTPGSGHFRAMCIDGEIQVDGCADYRNEVCVEERNNRGDGEEVSSAACVTNLWQLCLNYNSEVKGKKKEREASIEQRNEKCLKNPHCELKRVNAADNFKFDLCVPKYSPGFDLKKNSEGGELSCAFGNQKCTVVFVKEIGGWEPKVNEGCLKEGFAQQMNDLCMSLGDCGASVNYEGDLTLNYKVKNTKKLDKKYLAEISKYSEPVKGQYAKINATQYLDAVGGIARLGGNLKDQTPEGLDIAGGVTGALGMLMVAYPGVIAALSFQTLAYSSIGALEIVPILGPFGGVLAGAAIGFAVTSLLLQYTGVAAGLDPAVTWTLIGAGTLAGAVVGYTLLPAITGGGLEAAAGACATVVLCVVGIIVLVIVIIVIAIFAAIGIGDTKKKIVTFSCQPWQPPLGGAKCEECGKDGYLCSRYACNALGQSCEFINEGTGKEECVDINPGDVSAPVIRPWNDALSKGFRYEEVSDSGVKIVSEENDGCIGSYQNIVFGINLNEPGYCRYNFKHTGNFDEMENDEGSDFGDRNLFLYNHSQFFSVPDLASLGLPGYDPNRRAEFNMYARCIDSKGNGKDSKEYVMNLCVKPGEDKSAPIVTGREPLNEFVRFDADKLDAGVFTNEPAECKWDLDGNKKFDDMKNSMECINDVEDRESLFGWKCETTFDIEKNESVFYIKCKDQPWNAGNESKRNEMKEAYEFKVKKTANPLKIDSIKPNNETLVFGVEPATVILEVQTSGGIDGRAKCSLFGSPMADTFGKVHKQLFNRIYSGEYEFPIICEDIVGNSAQATSKFIAELDSTPPVVTRVYKQGGSLVVITNEGGKCAFVREGKKGEECGFAFANGTLMSGDDKFHTTGFDNGNYYIKCGDKWGHVSGECNVVVKGGEYAYKG